MPGRFALFLVVVFASQIAALAGLPPFKCGAWDLEVSEADGAWTSLKYKGEELFRNPDALQTIALNAGDGAKASKEAKADFDEAAGVAVAELKNLGSEKDLPVKLEGYYFDEKAGALTLRYSSGPWRISETAQFDADGRKGRLLRTVKFKSDAEADLKFKSLRYVDYLPIKGRYLFPATFFFDRTWRQDDRPGYPSFDRSVREGRVSRLKGSGNDRIKFAIIEPRPGLSLLFFVDSRMDNAIVRFKRESGSLRADSVFLAAGWALPGVEHELRGAYLEVCEKSAEETLKSACPRMLADLGFTPPSDSPAWVRDAVIFGSETEHFYGERLSDLGPCVAPRMKLLGFNTEWRRPVEASTSRYNPIDYKVCEPKAGSWADYRGANDAMHAEGFKVLEDVVPHGGGQLGVLLRGQSAKVLSVTESGCVLSSWACDFNQPDWRKYMESVAGFFVGEQRVDGFRVDAPYGSKSYDWRKKGFPANAPPVIAPGAREASSTAPRMLPALWERTMKMEGGSMPALEYPRASLASSGGGLNMVASIRAGSKRANRESALLLESAELPFTAAGDVHYDRDIQSCLFKLRALPPKDFVEGLSLWLEEQKYVDAPGSLRMRYLETGVTESWPYRLWFGFEGDKAMRALCYYIHGIPMCYESFTQGEGAHLARLGLLRREIEPLRRGDALYRAVQSSDPRVFTVLRGTSDDSALGVINFAPEAVKVALSIPKELLKTPSAAMLALYDAFSGRKLAEASKDALLKPELTLPPFGNALLVWRDAKAAVPSWTITSDVAKTPKTQSSASAPLLKKDAGAWTIASPSYTLKIDAKSGLFESFSKNGADAVGVEGDLLREFGSDAVACELVDESKDGVPVVAAKLSNATGPFARIVYKGLADRVEVSCESAKELEFAFAFPTAKRWQLDSFEGMLEDMTLEKPVLRKSYPSSFSEKRRCLRDRSLIWSSRERPFDGNRSEFRVFGSAPATIRFSTTGNPSCLYDSFDGSAGLELLCGFGGGLGNLDFSLRPDATREASLFGKPLDLGKGLKLTNESYGWRIENDSYVVHLLRQNGVVKALYAKTQKGLVPLLREQEIVAGKALSKGYPYLSAAMDPDSSIELVGGDGTLTMCFAGELRSAYRGGPLLRLFTEYRFGSGPEFAETVKLRSVAGNVAIPELVYSAKLDAEAKLLKRSASAAEDAGKVLDTSSADALEYKLFDGFAGRLVPQRDYAFKFVYRTDGAPCSEVSAPSVGGALKKLDEDPGFEKRLFRISSRSSKPVVRMKYDLDDKLFWRAGNATRLQKGVGVDGSAGVFMSWPNPEFVQNLNPVVMKPGRYKLSFQLKGTQLKEPAIKAWSDKLVTVHPFLKDYTPFEASIEYSDASGAKKTLSRKLELPKEYDWTRHEMVFEIPETGYAPFVRISAMPEYAGEICLDNLKWEEMK